MVTVKTYLDLIAIEKQPNSRYNKDTINWVYYDIKRRFEEYCDAQRNGEF